MNTKNTPRGLRLSGRLIEQMRLLASWLDEHPEHRRTRTGPPAAGLVDALSYAIEYTCRGLRLKLPVSDAE
jgi:hypothetical protein